MRYLYLHMGMTGRIRVEGIDENWGAKDINGETKKGKGNAVSSTKPSGGGKAIIDEEYKYHPKYTYASFTSTHGVVPFKAFFCDPRKFGSCHFADNLSLFDELAPDALDLKDMNVAISKLTDQRLGIKALLLDQKRVVSGVGNWVADETLYQCRLHPDQSYLTTEQASKVCAALFDIVQIAADSLRNQTHYPEDWLFHYRWTKKKSGKDALGNNITFITSGGRTSAIVAAYQKLYKSQQPSSHAKNLKMLRVRKVKKKKHVKSPDNGKKRKINESQIIIKVKITQGKSICARVLEEKRKRNESQIILKVKIMQGKSICARVLEEKDSIESFGDRKKIKSERNEKTSVPMALRRSSRLA